MLIFVIIIIAILSVLFAPALALAVISDVSTGTLQISGYIPEIFSLQVRGVPGDLDFSPKVVVNNRLLALIHLKYNIPVASFELRSSTVSGLPENSQSAPVPLATPMSYLVTCISAVSTPTPASVMYAGVDIKSAETLLLDGLGIEEDCRLTASWTGTDSTRIPAAGIYSEVLTLSITSQ